MAEKHELVSQRKKEQILQLKGKAAAANQHAKMIATRIHAQKSDKQIEPTFIVPIGFYFLRKMKKQRKI
jgi:hypothetical protein